MVTVAAALAVVVLALLVLHVVDRRRVRETNALIEQMRAGDTPVLLDDEIGDDIVAMVKAWQNEAGRP